MQVKTISYFFAVISLIMVLFFGCGKKENAGNQDEKKDQNTLQPDQQNLSNQNKPNNELGISEGMPRNYPSDIPVPLNAKNLGYLPTQEGTTVTFESTEKPKDIYKSFSEDIVKNGFKMEDDGSLISDDGGVALWKKLNNKDTVKCGLMLVWEKDKSKTSIVVTY